jgi:hypothetical protein
MIRSVAALVTSLAVAVWLGGLFALGAIAAPVVFAIVPLPASADAMTVVFRRFDLVATSCGAVVVLLETVRAVARGPAREFDPWPDRLRLPLSVLALASACVVSGFVSPRIAALHASGVVRARGAEGADLARLHDVAEWCGKAEVLLLLAFMALQVVSSVRMPTEKPTEKRRSPAG